MGEMLAYYAAADVVVVGGSLLPLGGQNLIEPCAVGRPVLFGPHTFNFESAAEAALAEGAGLRARDAARRGGDGDGTARGRRRGARDMGEARRALRAGRTAARSSASRAWLAPRLAASRAPARG